MAIKVTDRCDPISKGRNRKLAQLALFKPLLLKLEKKKKSKGRERGGLSSFRCSLHYIEAVLSKAKAV